MLPARSLCGGSRPGADFSRSPAEVQFISLLNSGHKASGVVQWDPISLIFAFVQGGYTMRREPVAQNPAHSTPQPGGSERPRSLVVGAPARPARARAVA
jgi:hypothetical protein